MAVGQIYKVLYHWERGGRKINQELSAYVDCADQSYNTIRSVIVTNQSQSHGGDTFVIDDVRQVGPPSVWQ
jgi:hypothetical protein